MSHVDDDLAASGEHLRREILAKTHRSLTSLAEHVTEFEHGMALRTPSLPLVWTLNQVRVAHATTADDVARLGDRHQGDLPYRHVVVEGGDARLVDELAARGWSIEREVLMAMTRHDDRGTDTSAVVELGEDQGLALMRAWLLEERPEITADGLVQVLEYYRREGTLFDERRLGVEDRGTPVAITKLRSDGDVAWVEDVYTLPAARGQGHSRSILEAVLRLAWADEPRFAYIVADDDDWPKEFYARAGFLPVGINLTFHRSGI